MDEMITMTLAVREPGADEETLDQLADLLRERIEETAAHVPGRPSGGIAPPGSRGVDVETAGAILVTAKASIDAVAAVVAVAREWLNSRATPARSVWVKLGDDEIRLDAATPEQQDRLIDGFLRAITPGDDGRP